MFLEPSIKLIPEQLVLFICKIREEEERLSKETFPVKAYSTKVEEMINTVKIKINSVIIKFAIQN